MSWMLAIALLFGVLVGASFGAAWEYQRGTVRLRKRYANLVQVAAESGWTDMVLAASADVAWMEFVECQGLL